MGSLFPYSWTCNKYYFSINNQTVFLQPSCSHPTLALGKINHLITRKTLFYCDVHSFLDNWFPLVPYRLSPETLRNVSNSLSDSSSSCDLIITLRFWPESLAGQIKGLMKIIIPWYLWFFSASQMKICEDFVQSTYENMLSSNKLRWNIWKN